MSNVLCPAVWLSDSRSAWLASRVATWLPGCLPASKSGRPPGLPSDLRLGRQVGHTGIEEEATGVPTGPARWDVPPYGRPPRGRPLANPGQHVWLLHWWRVRPLQRQLPSRRSVGLSNTQVQDDLEELDYLAHAVDHPPAFVHEHVRVDAPRRALEAQATGHKLLKFDRACGVGVQQLEQVPDVTGREVEAVEIGLQLLVSEPVLELLQSEVALVLAVELFEEPLELRGVLLRHRELRLHDRVPVAAGALDCRLAEDTCHDVEDGKVGEHHEDREDELPEGVDLAQGPSYLSPAHAVGDGLEEGVDGYREGPVVLPQDAALGSCVQHMLRGRLGEEHREDVEDEEEQDQGPGQGLQRAAHAVDQDPEGREELQHPHDAEHAYCAAGPDHSQV
mmetsp:Transcript_56416/g.167935  ORF Transcript_56416/g.167935 Transcript_56416/m.167935 type:complete len:392 (-) Transcript_56416:864-2039(-)